MALRALGGLGMLAVLATSLAAASPASARTARHLHARLYLFFDQDRLADELLNGGYFLREAENRPDQLRDAPFLATVTLANCKAGADGRCNVTVDYALLGPDGATKIISQNCPLWTGTPHKGAVMMAATSAHLQFEATDRAGAYVVRATVRDNVAQAEIVLDRRLTLEEPGGSSGEEQ